VIGCRNASGFRSIFSVGCLDCRLDEPTRTLETESKGGSLSITEDDVAQYFAKAYARVSRVALENRSDSLSSRYRPVPNVKTEKLVHMTFLVMTVIQRPDNIFCRAHINVT
jgi:hypothetical protein